MSHMNDNPELEKSALMVAEFHHRNQAYDIFPYMYHIHQVVDILRAAGYPSIVVAAGALHDVVEDGPLSISKVKRFFGNPVADIVADVTDPIDLANRKEKKIVVYTKLQKRCAIGNEYSLAVKLADRLANMRHSIAYQSEQSNMYKQEMEGLKLLYITCIDTLSPEAIDRLDIIWDQILQEEKRF